MNTKTQQPLAGGHLPGPDADQPGLYLFYQPFYNLRTGHRQGLEALLRQRVGEPPSFSLPSALLPCKDAEQLLQLDDWVARSATTQLAGWRSSRGVSETILAVNLTLPSLIDPVFSQGLRQHLALLDLPLDRILFDISAAALSTLALDAGVLAQIDRLRTEGFTFCIDGIDGPAQRALDPRLWGSVDIAKVSLPLLAADTGDMASAADRFDELCDWLHDQDLPILITGIETAEHLELARTRDCEWAQGYLLGEPTLPAASPPGTSTLSPPSSPSALPVLQAGSDQ